MLETYTQDIHISLRDLERLAERKNFSLEGDTEDRLEQIVDALVEEMAFEEFIEVIDWNIDVAPDFIKDAMEKCTALATALDDSPLTALEEAALAQGRDLRAEPAPKPEPKLFG